MTRGFPGRDTAERVLPCHLSGVSAQPLQSQQKDGTTNKLSHREDNRTTYTDVAISSENCKCDPQNNSYLVLRTGRPYQIRSILYP